MRALTDWELIAVLIMIVSCVVMIDDKSAERWCVTYQFCEEMETKEL